MPQGRSGSRDRIPTVNQRKDSPSTGAGGGVFERLYGRSRSREPKEPEQPKQFVARPAPKAPPRPVAQARAPVNVTAVNKENKPRQSSLAARQVQAEKAKGDEGGIDDKLSRL